MIKVSHLSKRFGHVTVLNDISYEFNKTGFYVLFGESGCGKTTFLNILCGLVPFDSGSVQYGSTQYQNQVNNDQIGFVQYNTQDVYLIDYLTIWDNLRVCCNMDEKIEALLEEFELSSCKEKYPHMLSGGEKQRIAIIQALLQEKKVLFLDEPTAALDYKNKIKVLKMLKKLKEQMLIICSSHDKEIFEFCDECIDVSNMENISSEHFEVVEQPRVMRENKSGYSTFHFMSKELKYPFREKKSKIILFIVFTIAVLTCFFCDTPENKINATIDSTYKLNQIYVDVKDKQFIDDCKKNNEVMEIAFNYNISLPLPSKEVDPDNVDSNATVSIPYDINLETLPFNKDAFRISDKLCAGSWYKNDDDIIIGKDLAYELSEDIDTLIGQEYLAELYDGSYSFTICGIFDEMTEIEAKYFEASGIYPENIDTAAFVNSKFTSRYEENDEFYSTEKGVKNYQVYFNSFASMYRVYKEYKGENTGISIRDYDNIYFDLFLMFEALAQVLYPILIIVVLLAIIFYYQTCKTKLIYSKATLCAYMYYGYSKKQVVWGYWKTQVGQIIVLLTTATVVGSIVSVIVNQCNMKWNFTAYRIFTINVWILLLLAIIIILSATILTITTFHKVKVNEWYDILKERRDLL